MDFSHLLNASVSGSMETTFTPVPEGDYLARIETIEVRSVDTKNGVSPIARLTWIVLDESLKASMDRDQIQVFQDLWLDLDATGALARGKDKNVGLGRVRRAVGQNDDGGEWNLGLLEGSSPAMVHIRHRQDKNDPERIYA
ncbi:MAG: hypothetical protein ACREJW_00070, partial [Candidatus Methylomirabilales bacterium]